MADNIALTEAVYYILLALSQPLHGYGIMQRTAELSAGRVRLAAGTLYGALSTLVQKGWIAEIPAPDSSRKREYRLTAAGRDIALGELARLEELAANGRMVLGNWEEAL